MVKISLRLSVSACLVLAPVVISPAAAEQQADKTTMPLDQLLKTEVDTVVGASRYQQHVTDAPASVTIVTADEIETFGYRTLADLLRGVRGFYVSYDRNYTTLGVRGFSPPGDYNTRLLVLIDGHRLNDNVYDAVLLGTDFPLDIEQIERVEIVRGPNSTTYGTNAVFAVVNVITKTAARSPAFSATVEGGSLGSAKARLGIARAFAGGGITASLSGYRSEGQDSIPYPELDAVASGMDHDDAVNAFLGTQLGSWQFVALRSRRTKQIPTGAYGIRFDDPRSSTTEHRGLVDASFQQSFRGTAIQWRGAVDWSRYEGTYVYQDDGGVTREFSDGYWLSTGGHVSRRLGRHHLSAGADWRGDLVQRQESWLDGDPSVIVDAPQQAYGAWIGDELSLGRALLLNGAISHDHFHGFGSSTNLRTAAIFKPTTQTTLKFLHGTAFRAPNAYERFYYEGGSEARLAPETVRTTELVFERRVRHGLRLTGNVFSSSSRHLIALVEDEDNFLGLGYANFEAAETRGVEIETDVQATSWLGGSASYGYQRGRRAGDHLELTNSPRHLAQLRFRATTSWVNVGIEAIHVGRRLTLQGEAAPQSTLTNLTLGSRTPGTRTHLTLSVQNLFNTRLMDPASAEHPQGAILQDGRTVRLKATWAF